MQVSSIGLGAYIPLGLSRSLSSLRWFPSHSVSSSSSSSLSRLRTGWLRWLFTLLSLLRWIRTVRRSPWPWILISLLQSLLQLWIRQRSVRWPVRRSSWLRWIRWIRRRLQEVMIASHLLTRLIHTVSVNSNSSNDGMTVP